ncbi:fused MFS/spermidine synthase [Dechloromonas denitrificans]|uniref:fused MFS/spermidine synthase n=1 Tax=Dechloromonas denitrificans TaxID=281362 RepID=UPI001CFA5C51|nr:fused MFS/spermidine synthase [Dechloromonas denitrificans]UCV07567.1 fused MFS/spermidine synthase [Dechloromonas denitrificans]
MAEAQAASAAAPTAAAPLASAQAGSRRGLALALMVASGGAALGYQIVWTQQSALWLGHESAAVLAVVTAFFGGLALGALLLGPRIEGSARPARWYAGCEAAIGLWSLALVFLLGPISGSLLDLIGAQPSPAWHWTVAFFGTFLLLLPATASMGATLPAMERVLARMAAQGAPIAALYAGNTFGAVLGVLGAAFWLIPAVGLVVTAGLCALLNLLCAVLAMKLFADPDRRAPATETAKASGALLWLAATGLLGIGYEVLVVRVLSQVAENTVYTFAILLAVYLVGTALGAAAYDRWLPRCQAIGMDRLRDRLLRGLAAACLLGILSLAAAETLKAAALNILGNGMAAALAAETMLAIAAFLLPTIAMGALFSHLGCAARATGISFARALGVNTLGAAIAPPLFGVLLLPLGPKFVLLLVVAGYLALSTRRAWAAPSHWLTAGAALTLAVLAPSLAIIDIPDGGRLLSHVEGPLATVSIVEDANGVDRLHINNRQQEGSSATLLADARQAILPLLLHPAPRRALFLGLGTGITAYSATGDPALEVDAVELLPEVIDASAHFTRMIDGDPARLHLMTADARRFVRTSRASYDLIVSDNFHPARSGSGSLYTVEHFRAVHDRLAPGGLFCQWLPLHQLDLDTLRSIVRAFQSVYPNSWAILATNSLETPAVGLVARQDGAPIDLIEVRQRLAATATSLNPLAFGINDELALLGSFIAGPGSLTRFAGNAPLNTDDHPVVAYRAPRLTYAPDSLPRDRLIALLHELEISPDELLAAPRESAETTRLAAYWAARNRFIEAGRNVQPMADVRRMLGQVREPLLAILRTSPDFRPAYDPLLRMAGALSRVDVAAARALLHDLQQAQPARPEAAQALHELGGATR